MAEESDRSGHLGGGAGSQRQPKWHGLEFIRFTFELKLQEASEGQVNAHIKIGI